MNTDTSPLIRVDDTNDADPIAEIHEIRRLVAEHGSDPHQLGAYLRQRQKQRGTPCQVILGVMHGQMKILGDIVGPVSSDDRDPVRHPAFNPAESQP